jgi:hypothetical protein
MAMGLDTARLDLVRAKADSWADDLIDFGPNNILLYHRDSKTWGLDLSTSVTDAVTQLLSGRKTRLETLVGSGSHANACQRAQPASPNAHVPGGTGSRRRRQAGTGPVPVAADGDKGAAPVKPLRAPLVLQPLTITPRTAAETDYVLELAAWRAGEQ